MQATENAPSVILTTDCFCEYYNDDNELVSPDSCFGDCYEDAVDYFDELAGLFIKANNLSNADYLLIEGSSMGWTRASGYKLIRAEIEQLRHALMLNGDFTIEFWLSSDDKELTARRYSHDEPMGTGLLTFTKVDVCQYSGCESMENLKDYKGDKYCEFCYEIAELNW